MNIGFLIFSLGGGGAERVVTTIANRLSEKGYNIYIYIFSGDIAAYEVNSSIKIRVCGENKRAARLIRIVNRERSLSKHLRYDAVDLLFAFMTPMIPYALAARGSTNCKIVGSERKNPIMHKVVFQWVIRYLSPFCDGYIFQTEGAKTYYPKRTQDKGIVIPNSAPVYEKVWKRPNAILICSTGRLHQDKDFGTLIRAFSIFNKKYNNSVLMIFGDGEQKEELVELVQQLGIADKVIFRGFVHNILDEINQCSMFVFSSVSEGMPNALIEAMSVGLPCISTDCPYGPADLIRNGENGWLVPVGDVTAMSEKMIWIVENPEEAERMGEKARKIQEKNSEEKIIRQYIKYIDSLIS